MLVLNGSQTAAALDSPSLMDAVRDALVAIDAGTLSAPPRVAAFTPHGLLGAMPAYVDGMGLAAKLVSIAPDARTGGLAHGGLVALFDEQDGRPIAVMDAAAVTAARTAAAATLSLAVRGGRPIRRVAIVGTGVQAQAQLSLLGALGNDLLDPQAEVTVAGRSPEAAERLAAKRPDTRTAGIEQAVRGADVVFCCTSAREPVIRREWLALGAHVSSVGGSEGHEVDDATIADAELYVEWAGAAAQPPPAGAHELQGVPPERLRLLGGVLARPETHTSERLTVFKSTGHAALDVAAAVVVHRRALATGAGVDVEM